MPKVRVKVGAGESYPYGAEVIVASAEVAARMLPNSRVMEEIGDDVEVHSLVIDGPRDAIEQGEPGSVATENTGNDTHGDDVPTAGGEDESAELEVASDPVEDHVEHDDVSPSPRKRGRRKAADAGE